MTNWKRKFQRILWFSMVLRDFNLCTVGLQNRSILSGERGPWIVFQEEPVVKLNLKIFIRAKANPGLHLPIT